jgi:hypothetical protein
VPEQTKTIYVIAGCNGAGKTTFAREYLPHEAKCLRFLNADELARGLSPLDPAAGAFKAGRLLLREVHEAISKGETFALESTLSGAHLRERVPRSAQARLLYRTALPLARVAGAGDRSRSPARAQRRTRCSGGGYSTPIRSEPKAFAGGLSASQRAMDGLGQSRTTAKTSGIVPPGRYTLCQGSAETMRSTTIRKPASKADLEFIAGAQRAFRRVARKLRAESKRTGIPLAVWPQKDIAPKKKKG